MRADRIKLGMIVDLGAEREPAEVLDVEVLDDERVSLRLRQEGKRRGCWVAIPSDVAVKTLRR